jgi:hypothetical protein
MMKIFEELNEKNFKLYAAHYYDNPSIVDVDEFEEDLSRFKYLKRLLKRYELDHDLQERLILNHLIVIYNVFGIEASNKMVWYKIEKEHWAFIKPFLIFLNYLDPEEKIEVPLDSFIIERLRKL